MRLIDADELNKKFDDEHFTEWCDTMDVPLYDRPQLDGFHIGLAQGQVFLQPIAYDVDKVIEQLDNQKDAYCLYEEDREWVVKVLDDAIDIVRKGGIE